MNAAASRRGWRAAVVLVSLAAGLTVTFALGPLPDPGEPDLSGALADVPSDPAALPAWLAAREAAVAGITPGAEKSIVWASPTSLARTPLALVYVPGFSATRQEISPVIERAAHDLGANAFLTRTTGHGLPGDALADVMLADWQEDVAEAVRVGQVLGERVVLVGCSTGATLAASYALAHQGGGDALLGVVLFSPNLGPRNAGAELVLWPWGSVLLPPLLGDRVWEPKNELQAKYWTTRYPSAAIVPMMLAVDELRSADVSGNTLPFLVVHHPGDDVVDPAQVEAWAAKVPHLKDEHVTDDQGDLHVLAGDILSPARTDRVVALLTAAVREWAR